MCLSIVFYVFNFFLIGTQAGRRPEPVLPDKRTTKTISGDIGHKTSAGLLVALYVQKYNAHYVQAMVVPGMGCFTFSCLQKQTANHQTNRRKNYSIRLRIRRTKKQKPVPGVFCRKWHCR